MKTNYRHISGKSAKKWWVLAAIILIALGIGGYLIFSNRSDNKSKPWENQAAENTQNAKDTEDAEKKSNENGPVTVTNKGSVTISNFSENVSTVFIRAIVSGAPEGACLLDLSKSGATTITKTANIEPVTTYYSCAFDIPKSEIKESGVWTASVKVKDSSEPAASATLNINK